LRCPRCGNEMCEVLARAVLVGGASFVEHIYRCPRCGRESAERIPIEGKRAVPGVLLPG